MSLRGRKNPSRCPARPTLPASPGFGVPSMCPTARFRVQSSVPASTTDVHAEAPDPQRGQRRRAQALQRVAPRPHAIGSPVAHVGLDDGGFGRERPRLALRHPSRADGRHHDQRRRHAEGQRRTLDHAQHRAEGSSSHRSSSSRAQRQFGPGNLAVEDDDEERRHVGAPQADLCLVELPDAHRQQEPAEPGDRREQISGSAE